MQHSKCAYHEAMCLNSSTQHCQHSAKAVTAHMSTDAIVCCRARLGSSPTSGARGVFFFEGGAKWGTRDNKGGGGVWSWAHGASCQRGSCARSGDKEGELVLIWAAVQSKLDWDGGGEELAGCRHTSDRCLYVRRGPQRTKRHRERVFLCRDRRALRHLGYLFTQQRLKSLM